MKRKLKQKIKSIIYLLFTPLLSGFKNYRKWMGGIWYHVGDGDEMSGFAGSIHYWTQKLEFWEEQCILETEQYI